MVTVDATCTTDMMKPSEKSESEEYMMGDAYRVAKQAYDKKDKTMTTRDAGLTKEQVEAAEVHAAGSSHCGEIKSKSAFSRDSTKWSPGGLFQAPACMAVTDAYIGLCDAMRTCASCSSPLTWPLRICHDHLFT
jgi:hypothetical protein